MEFKYWPENESAKRPHEPHGPFEEGLTTEKISIDELGHATVSFKFEHSGTHYEGYLTLKLSEIAMISSASQLDTNKRLFKLKEQLDRVNRGGNHG